MTAAHAHQAGVVELGRKGLGVLLLKAEPIGHGCDRGPASRIVADLLVKGLAEGAGTAAGLGMLIHGMEPMSTFDPWPTAGGMYAFGRKRTSTAGAPMSANDPEQTSSSLPSCYVSGRRKPAK